MPASFGGGEPRPARMAAPFVVAWYVGIPNYVLPKLPNQMLMVKICSGTDSSVIQKFLAGRLDPLIGRVGASCLP